MIRRRSKLPSLGALLVFDTVVRAGSFTAAGATLNVTQAAISKRIRELESALGKQLFDRRGRRIELTQAGLTLSEKTASALDFLEEACAELTAGETGERVTIAANAAVTHFWLAPALGAYGPSRPELSLRLSTSDHIADLVAKDISLAVLYGDGVRIGWTLELLFAEELTPVAAPDYAAYLRERGSEIASQLQHANLLDYERIEPDWVNWGAWQEAAGLNGTAPRSRRRCASYAAAISAARAGEGLALGSLNLLSMDLASGRLVALDAPVVATGRGYFLGHRSDAVLGPETLRLRTWLLRRAPGRRHPTSTDRRFPRLGTLR
jgi:DNA-binding transcriptional LysR family regulator